MADHYQHLALLGGTALVGYGWSRARGRFPAAALVCALAALTWRQARIYRDPESPYRATLARLGRPAEAINHLGRALDLDPNDLMAHNNLGNVLLMTGQIAEATAHYEAVLRVDPGDAQARQHLALARQLMDSRRGP